MVSTHLNKHASQTGNLPHQTFQAQEVVLHPRDPRRMWSQNGRPWELSKLSYQDEDCHVWFMRLVSCNPQLSTLPSCWVSRFFFANIKGTGVNMSSRYCWWKKSCTTWDVKSHVNNGINYLSLNWLAISEPSTVASQNIPKSQCPAAPAACAAPALAGALAGSRPGWVDVGNP